MGCGDHVAFKTTSKTQLESPHGLWTVPNWTLPKRRLSGHCCLRPDLFLRSDPRCGRAGSWCTVQLTFAHHCDTTVGNLRIIQDCKDHTDPCLATHNKWSCVSHFTGTAGLLPGYAVAPWLNEWWPPKIATKCCGHLFWATSRIINYRTGSPPSDKKEAEIQRWLYKQELRNACENNKIYLEFRMEEENISTALYLTSLYR